jgi:hypothetical protein
MLCPPIIDFLFYGLSKMGLKRKKKPKIELGVIFYH